MSGTYEQRNAKGCKHWQRTTIAGVWEIECIQWYKPRDGISKAVNRLDTDGSLLWQQVWYDRKQSGTFELWSRMLDTIGHTLFTLETMLLKDNETASPCGAAFRYRRCDGTLICDMTTTKMKYTVENYSESGEFTSREEQPHLDNGELEFFERDGRNITFESFKTIRDDSGNIIERVSNSRVWKYMKAEDGKPIMRMYKNGAFQRDRYIEYLHEDVQFPLLFVRTEEYD